MSNSIYTPYTYLIGWSKHNKFYYGRRTAKGCHPSEFWLKYFTSSKEVKNFRKKYGEPDIKQIRKKFNNKEDCCLWEEKVLSKMDVAHNEIWLNKKNGDSKWDVTGKTIVVDSIGTLFLISINDEKYLNGEVVHFLKNKKFSNEHRKNISLSKKGKIPSCVYTRRCYKGSGNPRAKPITIGGVYYNTQKEAFTALNISKSTFMKRYL
jgi:hypothetical protein